MRRLFILGVLLSGCDSGTSTPAPVPGPGPSPAPAPAPVGVGTIVGFVRVKGDDFAPVLKKIAGQEQHCGAEPVDLGVWRVDAATRGLRDAHVAVAGVKGTFAAGPVPVLDNGKCVFSPPVVLMPPGDLKIANSDTLPHSANFAAVMNPAENVMLPEGKSRLTTLRIAERIEVTCSVHPWMHAVVIVMASPFESLTDEAGRFEIRGVPAGNRKLKIWHRCTGETEIEVDVKADGKAEVEVELAPTSGFRGRFR